MNEYEYRKQVHALDEELSRPDLLVLGTMLGGLAVLLAEDLLGIAGLGDRLLNVALALAFTGGAVGCFWTALHWSWPSRELAAQLGRKQFGLVPASGAASGSEDLNVGSRAA